MRTISYRAEDLRTAVIGIGYVGENEHTQVRIDCGTIFAEYPEASAGMTIVPPAGAAYPKVVTRDGDVVVWDVTDSDLASEGSGEMQLSFVVSNVVVKSCIAQICVQRSITGNGPAPDPMDDWLTEASETLAEVDEALAAIPETIDTALEQAKASGEFDGPQGEPGQDGQDGAPGADGFSPTATVTKSGKVVTITITDKNGTTEETVSDGESGAQIDDTAGEGATNVTWSANKLDSEFGGVLNAIQGIEDEVLAKAPAIKGETEKRNTFSSSDMKSIGSKFGVVIPKETGVTTEYVSYSEDLIPMLDPYSSSENIFSMNNNIVHINGVASSSEYLYGKYDGSTNIPINKEVKANDVISLILSAKGTVVSAGATNSVIAFTLRVIYTDTTYDSYTDYMETDSTVATRKITVPKDVSAIRIFVQVRKDYNFTDYDLSMSIVLGEFATMPVSDGIVLDSAVTGTNGIVMYPIKGALEYVEDTKKYVDEHMPTDMLTKDDLVYISPEMYGAKGDNSTDDSTAFQTAVNAAISKGAAFRAYGKYRINSTVTFEGNNMDIYIHYIDFRGINTVAVVLHGKNNHLVIDTLYAYHATGSVGFRLETTSTMDASYNVIEIQNISTKGNCVEYLNMYGSSDNTTLYYNKFYTSNMLSDASNCFYFNGYQHFSENSFWGKHISNPYGYFLYCETEVTAKPENRFYEFSIEAESKNGIYGCASLINCRTAECADRKTPNNDEGNVFVFDGVLPSAKVEGTFIDYESVIVDNAATIDDRKEYLAQLIDEGKTNAIAYAIAFPQQITDYIIGKCNRLWAYYAVSQNGNVKCPTGKLIAYYNHKGFVPDFPWKHTIAVGTYEPIITDGYIPTIFEIEENTTITLDDSYCCIGINEIQIIQKDGKKAIVYNKDNIKIFDGASLSDGVYKLSCTMTPYVLSVDVSGNIVTFGPEVNEGKYFITNEEWTTEKMNIL